MENIPKIRIFPHGYFRDELEVRNWLAGGLRIDRKGVYLLREARELMQPGAFPRGSIALFEKKGFIVGVAICEDEPRKSTKEEREFSDAGEEWAHGLKFIPDSIWAWSRKQFINLEDLRKIVKQLPKHLRGRYPELGCADFLKILQEVAKR